MEANSVETWAWVQTLATIVLVAITAFYAYRTHEIANDTRLTARATSDVAGYAQREWRDGTKPIIVFRNVFSTGHLPTTFGVEFINGGVGPALNVRINLIEISYYFEIANNQGLVAMPAGDKMSVMMRGADPPDDESRARAQGLSSDDPVWRIGVLEATYLDVHGRSMTSTVELELAPAETVPRLGKTTLTGGNMDLSGGSAMSPSAGESS